MLPKESMGHDDKEILQLTNEIAGIESKLKDNASILDPKAIDLLRSRLAYLNDKIKNPDKDPE